MSTKQTITLVENETDSLQQPMAQELNKAIDHFERELVKIRTGRAHTSIVEDVPVSCYGQPNTVPLKQVATLAAPEVRLITIQPWDANVIADVERALNASNLGLTPINDGGLIRLQLPEMSSNRRDELVKILGKKLEECKIAIRNVRKDYQNVVRDAKKDKDISENFFNRLSDVLQQVTDSFITKAESMAEKKKKDLTTI